MRYDDPNATVRRETTQNNVAGLASATMTKFLFFQKTRVKKVHALVCAVGTHDDAGLDIYNGTTSVGAIAIGTAAAGTVHSSAELDSIVAANGMLDIRGKANSATTLVVSLAVEHEVIYDAVQS